MTTMTEKPNPIRKAFQPDTEALVAADGLAAKLAADDHVDAAEIRAVCQRVGWNEPRLTAEVARMTQVLAAKRRVEAGVQAQAQMRELGPKFDAAHRRYDEARKRLETELAELDAEYKPLKVAASAAGQLRAQLRGGLLPVHERETIAAIQEQLEGMMPQRRDMERTIEKLKRPYVEDAEIARRGNREYKEKHRNKIAALNKHREENLRNLERGHEELLGRMARLQQRQEQLRSRYVAAVK